jgi:hypothetical protein
MDLIDFNDAPGIISYPQIGFLLLTDRSRREPLCQEPVHDFDIPKIWKIFGNPDIEQRWGLTTNPQVFGPLKAFATFKPGAEYILESDHLNPLKGREAQ